MSKKIILMPNTENKSINIKLKMSQTKVNSAGQALKTHEGDLQKVDVDVKDAIQIPGTYEILSPSLTSRGLKTGLDTIVNNPYEDEDFYNNEWSERMFKGKKKAKLQHILEYKHGKEFNYYTNQHFDRVSKSTDIATLPFFLTPMSKITLDGSIKILNLDNPLHEVHYYTLLAHKKIANSYKELKGEKLGASYYIQDGVEVEDVKMNEKRKMNKAVAMLEEIFVAEGGLIVAFARVLGNDEKALTKKRAYSFIDSFFRGDSAQHVRFVKYYTLYKDAARRDEFFAAAKIQEYLNYGVIRKRDNKYFWLKPGIDDTPDEAFEWSGREKLIKDFILAPEYQKENELLETLLKSKIKAA